MSLTVYGVPLSPFVRKVRVLLAEKGIDYTLEQVNIFPMPEWFQEISPLRRIPVLRDTDVGEDATLGDSSVICAYLDKKYPEKPLYPAEPFAYARALWFEEYTDSDVAGQIGLGMFRPMVVNKLMGNAPDRATADTTFKEKLPRYLSYLDREIAGKEYYAGDQFSIADISVGSQFVNFEHAGYTLDTATYPNLTAFLERVHARPCFAGYLAEERAMIAKIMG